MSETADSKSSSKLPLESMSWMLSSFASWGRLSMQPVVLGRMM